MPISGSGWGEDLYTDPEMPSNESINFGKFMVDEHGLEAFGLELVAGRMFTPDEMVTRSFEAMEFARVLVISQALADDLFPDGDALGKTVWDEPNGQQPMEIIGIYDHMQNAWPTSTNVNNTALTPEIRGRTAPTVRPKQWKVGRGLNTLSVSGDRPISERTCSTLATMF